MKNYCPIAALKYLSIILLIVTLFSACQHELSFGPNETRSSGTLKQAVSGNCLPMMIGGTYVAGNATGDTNFIDVQVRVTRPGTFSIQSDTINGLNFSRLGTFPDTGLISVRLQATGVPLLAGINHFKVRYDTTECIADLTIMPDLNLIPATYTLAGAPNNCTAMTVVGNYIKSNALDTGNRVTLQIQVSSPGTYSIHSDTVNGYSFSGSGIATITGLQPVSLQGNGRPANGGRDTFTITGSGSMCNFYVAVTEPVLGGGSSYFPLVANSYWIYDDLFNPGDTIKRVASINRLVNGNNYTEVIQTSMFGDTTQMIYRRSGNDYLQFVSVDNYTYSLDYSPRVYDDILFLKEDATTGSNWVSPQFTGLITGGQPVYIRYDYTCVAANVAVTLNGMSFVNVLKIKMLPKIRSGVTLPWTETGEEMNMFYAKSVGLIYVKEVNNQFTKKEWRIRRFQAF